VVFTRASLALAVVTAALFACKSGEAPDATPADTAKAEAACREEADYEPGESAKPLAELDAHCAKAGCPWRKKIAGLCYFYGPRTQGHYHVYTTIPTSDTITRTDICDTLRESRAFASFTPIHLYCVDGKSCSTCGGGAHR
jgi:hypothetical protein